MRFAISILGTEVLAFDTGNYVLVEAADDQDDAPKGIESGQSLVAEQSYTPQDSIEARNGRDYGFRPGPLTSTKSPSPTPG